MLKNINEELKNINREKCNIFSIGLICLSVKFDEIGKLKKDAELNENEKVGLNKWYE